MRRLVSQLLALAWPVALARLGIMSMGVCDVVVVGQLAPHELPHQALGWAPTGVFLVTAIGLLTGVQVLASRALGAGTAALAGGALQCGLAISAVVGALAIAIAQLFGEHMFAAFGVAPELIGPSTRIMQVLMLSIPLHLAYVAGAFFVEALQRPLISTWLMWIANVVNLVINLWLVPRLGALGSAWATVCARGFLAVTLLAWIWLQTDARDLGLRKLSSGWGYRSFLAVGTAAALSQAAEAGAFSGMTILAGRLGGEAVAAYQILLNLLAVVFMVSLGFAAATAVLASRAVGRIEPLEAIRVSWFGLALNTLLMLGIAALVIAAAGPIARAYTTDPSITQVVLLWMPLVALASLADGGQVVVSSALRAQGDNWAPTASHLLAYACVMPLVAVVLAEQRGLGVQGLLLAVNWASFLSVAVLMARLWALTRRARAQHPAHDPAQSPINA
jgi:MATE family multidrug resistance protein